MKSNITTFWYSIFGIWKSHNNLSGWVGSRIWCSFWIGSGWIGSRKLDPCTSNSDIDLGGNYNGCCSEECCYWSAAKNWVTTSFCSFWRDHSARSDSTQLNCQLSWVESDRALWSRLNDNALSKCGLIALWIFWCMHAKTFLKHFSRLSSTCADVCSRNKISGC